MSTDSRYPYTYCADYICSVAGYGENGTKLSRCDAGQIRKAFANILGISDHELACKIADYYKQNQEEITDMSNKALMDSLGI